MVVPIPLNSQQRGLLLPWCFTEPLVFNGEMHLSTVRTHVTTCAVPFWPWCCKHSFSEVWLLAHTYRSNYFYISVHVLADTQGKKRKKKKQMSKLLNESWWQGIRCSLPSPLCTHSDPIAIDFSLNGLADAGPWDRHGALPLSPAQLTPSVLARYRQGTSQVQVSQIKTGLLLAACSIPNVCQGCLLVICLPVWDDSLLTLEHRLWS